MNFNTPHQFANDLVAEMRNEDSSDGRYYILKDYRRQLIEMRKIVDAVQTLENYNTL